MKTLTATDARQAKGALAVRDARVSSENRMVLAIMAAP